ncbi:MAG: DUF2256 and DUF3253 domain-containing protein [Myxococcales bacterium]|nr:DUF2256 and DUF3253 domain-containing protein [Myxococcales bacterium]
MESKSCAVCGRTIEWRKKWARTWNEVKYCSEGCRKRKRQAGDDTLERRILEALSQRAGDATICPSEIARSAAPDDWRPLMEPVREAARRLVATGVLDITQGGRVVDGSTARGPIRLRLRR